MRPRAPGRTHPQRNLVLPVVLLLLIPLPLAPAGIATPAVEPERGSVRLEGTPHVGEPVDLVAVVGDPRVNRSFVVVVPDWVSVEGPDRWNPKDAPTQRWTLTPQREGFWVVSLSPEGEETEGAAWYAYGFCCAYGYDLGDGLVGTGVGRPSLPAEVDAHVRAEVADEGVLVTYRVTPRFDWMRNGTLRLDVRSGVHVHSGTGSDGVEVTWERVLEDNETWRLDVDSWWNGTVEHPSLEGPTETTRTGCRNVQVQRRGDQVVVLGDDPCGSIELVDDVTGARPDARGWSVRSELTEATTVLAVTLLAAFTVALLVLVAARPRRR